MNRIVYFSLVAGVASVLIIATGCGSSKSTPPPPVISIAATSGSGQKAMVSAAFGTPLVAKVTQNGMPASGVTVTFTAPASGASGNFGNGTATEKDTTDSSGLATSSTFIANSQAGAYSVTATVDGASGSAEFSLSNAAIATTFSFYAAGLESINCPNSTCSFYAVAGTVALDATNSVLAGVQDYNDGTGETSPQPTGDAITGGSLSVDATGQGTLTLITNNGALGLNGTETLGVQFVNSKHALIAQFDGSATSSGSMDLQTTTGLADGHYAFTLSGVNSNYFPVAVGGIFTVSGDGVDGTVDVNDNGTVTLANAITGSVTPADMFGRGQITGVSLNGVALALNYYLVTPEAIHIIDVDANSSNDPSAGNAAVGSAFSQGAGSFTNASIGKSVFAVQSNSWGATFYAAAGLFITNPGAGKFTGIGDDHEESQLVSASPISGTYSMNQKGYGNLQIGNTGLLDVTSWGLYATDPTLNLLDPNNASGGGEALILDLDSILASGTGVLVPQTDPSAASFIGSYAFAAQDFNDQGALGWEFDCVGQGSVANGVLTGTGLVNDSFAFFSSVPTLYSSVPFAGTATPDLANPGRYTMMPLDITAVSGSPVSFSVVIYQASGETLFWMDESALSLSLGTIQQKTEARLGSARGKSPLTTTVLGQKRTRSIRRFREIGH